MEGEVLTVGDDAGEVGELHAAEVEAAPAGAALAREPEGVVAGLGARAHAALRPAALAGRRGAAGQQHRGGERRQQGEQPGAAPHPSSPDAGGRGQINTRTGAPAPRSSRRARGELLRLLASREEGGRPAQLLASWRSESWKRRRVVTGEACEPMLSRGR